jgi:hypothetical protein
MNKAKNVSSPLAQDSTAATLHRLEIYHPEVRKGVFGCLSKFAWVCVISFSRVVTTFAWHSEYLRMWVLN